MDGDWVRMAQESSWDKGMESSVLRRFGQALRGH